MIEFLIIIMFNFDITNLVSLLKDSEVNKEELISNIEQIQFKPISSLDFPIEEKKKGSKEEVVKNSQTLSSKNTSSMKTPSKPSFKTTTDLAVSPRKLKKSPKTSKPPLGKVSSSRNVKEPHDYSKFLKRIEGYQLYKKSQMMRREELVRSIEMQECRFKPEINEQYSIPRAKIHERLYHQNKEKLQKLHLKQQLLKNDSMKPKYTFKPIVNSSKAKPRYMGTLKELATNSRNANGYYNTAYTILTNDPQMLKGDQATSRNVYYQLSQSSDIKRIESSNTLKMIGDETTEPISRVNSPQCSNYNEKSTVSHTKKDKLIKNGDEEKKKRNNKIVFDFDMFKRNSEGTKKTKELLTKFHKEIDNCKKSIKPNSDSLSNDGSFLGGI